MPLDPELIQNAIKIDDDNQSVTFSKQKVEFSPIKELKHERMNTDSTSRASISNGPAPILRKSLISLFHSGVGFDSQKEQSMFHATEKESPTRKLATEGDEPLDHPIFIADHPMREIRNHGYTNFYRTQKSGKRVSSILQCPQHKGTEEYYEHTMSTKLKIRQKLLEISEKQSKTPAYVSFIKQFNEQYKHDKFRVKYMRDNVKQ